MSSLVKESSAPAELLRSMTSTPLIFETLASRLNDCPGCVKTMRSIPPFPCSEPKLLSGIRN